MMTYTSPDGHVIESVSYPQETTYSCQCSITEYYNGIYYSDEIKGAATQIGIQGIHITRTVDNGNMTIKIIEFSEQELINYINDNTLI